MEWRVACTDDRDGSSDYISAILIGEIMAVPEGLEGGENIRPKGDAGGLEVDEESEGLRWIGIEDAVDRGSCVVGLEFGIRVLLG